MSVGSLLCKNSKDEEDTASWVQILVLTAMEATQQDKLLVSLNLSFPFCKRVKNKNCFSVIDALKATVTTTVQNGFLLYMTNLSYVIVIITIGDLERGQGRREPLIWQSLGVQRGCE